MYGNHARSFVRSLAIEMSVAQIILVANCKKCAFLQMYECVRLVKCCCAVSELIFFLFRLCLFFYLFFVLLFVVFFSFFLLVSRCLGLFVTFLFLFSIFIRFVTYRVSQVTTHQRHPLFSVANIEFI